MASSTRTALVFGASGITGWAILREAVQYPSASTFCRIIGLTNRPLDKSSAFLPDDERICLVAGIDLTTNAEAVAAKLQEIEGIGDVTDVFFAAYIQPQGTSDIEGHEELKRVNVAILEVAVEAVKNVCPKLEFWSLQTGGKSYGFVHAEFIGLPKVPCRESDPRIPSPYAEQLFYYAQYDVLTHMSAGKRWKFAEIRPDSLIGFVPGGRNAMNIAQAIGVFLAFFVSRSGEGATVPFPGNPAAYVARHTEVGQRTLARAHLFCSALTLRSSARSGECYNVGDTDVIRGTSWEEKWPALCEYFGLVGVGPGECEGNELHAGDYMHSHCGEWEMWETENQLVPGVVASTSWEFMVVIFEMAIFDRQYDLKKLADAGFKQHQDIVEAYMEVFDSMRRARMIP